MGQFKVGDTVWYYVGGVYAYSVALFSGVVEVIADDYCVITKKNSNSPTQCRTTLESVYVSEDEALLNKKKENERYRCERIKGYKEAKIRKIEEIEKHYDNLIAQWEVLKY